jgi:hypothetical protein
MLNVTQNKILAENMTCAVALDVDYAMTFNVKEHKVFLQ